MRWNELNWTELNEINWTELYWMNEMNEMNWIELTDRMKLLHWGWSRSGSWTRWWTGGGGGIAGGIEGSRGARMKWVITTRWIHFPSLRKISFWEKTGGGIRRRTGKDQKKQYRRARIPLPDKRDSFLWIDCLVQSIIVSHAQYIDRYDPTNPASKSARYRHLGQSGMWE